MYFFSNSLYRVYVRKYYIFIWEEDVRNYDVFFKYVFGNINVFVFVNELLGSFRI